MAEISYGEGDGEADLYYNEDKLDPEGDAEDAVFSEMNSKTLVFPADEDRRDDVSNDKEQEHHIVYPGIPSRIEDTEQDQAASAHDCEYD